MKQQHIVSGYWVVQSRMLDTAEWYNHEGRASFQQQHMPAHLWDAVEHRMRDLAQPKGGFGPLSTKGKPLPSEMVRTILQTRCLHAAAGDEVEYEGHAFRYAIVSRVR